VSHIQYSCKLSNGNEYKRIRKGEMMVVVMSIDGKLPVPLKVLQDRVQSKEDKKSGLKLKSNEKKKKGTRSKMRLKILKFWISDF
jgi:hypothetical protein